MVAVVRAHPRGTAAEEAARSPARSDRSRSRPRVRDGIATAVALAVVVAGPFGAASATYNGSTQSNYRTTVSQAYELSGLVASPQYPNWYWAHSDTWEPTDSNAACSDLSGSALRRCQQVQRTRIWALRIDPVTRRVTASRSFVVRKPAWALDPLVAQNNDWEDIALSPPRTGGGRNLVLGATGDAAHNRIHGASARDITCSTRRLIELREPDLSDPSVTTWTPWKIYDLDDPVGLGNLRSCNFESLLVGQDRAGSPTAYLVSKAQGKLYARSLDVTTGRDPGTDRSAAGSGLPHQAAIRYVGDVRDSTSALFTAGDTRGSFVSLLARKTARQPCQIFTWPVTSAGLGEILTHTSPVKSRVHCGDLTPEGLTYVRDADDPAVATRDLLAVTDAGDNADTFAYHYFPYTWAVARAGAPFSVPVPGPRAPGRTSAPAAPRRPAASGACPRGLRGTPAAAGR